MRSIPQLARGLGALVLLALGADRSGAADALAADLTSRIDTVVTAALAHAEIPSASIALVRNRSIVYTHAYGWAQLNPRRAATADMPYPIASNTKVFTAAAVLLLRERGLLSLDDPAGKFLSNLGPASAVTLRELLSHTGGVRDFFPQGYNPPQLLRPIEPRAILDRWARQPLDFPPGTEWQYSNTDYTIAGLIVERLTHTSLFQFWQSTIFKPLGMTSPLDYSAGPLPEGGPAGYTRYALGPARPAQREGLGWTFGAGQLAMTAADLARWDISLMDRQLLRPQSYRELTREVQLKNGVGTGYALGLAVGLDSGRRLLQHAGGLAGFTSYNRIYPDEGVAVVVLLNGEGDISAAIARDLSRILLAEAAPAEAAAQIEARQMLSRLQHGHIEAARLTANARSYFTPEVLADYGASLAPLGDPQAFALQRSVKRGGLVVRTYEATFAQKKLAVITESAPDGRLEQYLVRAE